MQLKTFQVLNYRSVNDSGVINVTPRTVVVGRNESGKTNLLEALQSLNPPGGIQALSYVKDFPRHKNPSEFDESLTVLKTSWALEAEETETLGKLFPRAKGITELTISRPYKAIRRIGFVGLPALELEEDEIDRRVKSFERVVKNRIKDCLPVVSEKAGRALNVMTHELVTGLKEPVEWSNRVIRVINVFKQTFASLKLDLPDTAQKHLQSIEEQAREAAADRNLHSKALDWVIEKLPVFVYLNDYPQLNGHQNIRTFVQHLERGNLSEAEQNFARLCKVAELDPSELVRSLNTEHQQRQLMTNRAGAILTEKLRKLWSERPVKVRFNLDAEHFDTLVSDPSDIYDIEVNLEERSRGFKWFFSFYITFAADTDAGMAKNAIVLLDEPGMHLHALAQRDLLDHFIKDFPNPTIYTTHSPFMIPVEDLGSIRTVKLDADGGTLVSNTPTGDANTLFPLRAALSYHLAQQLSCDATQVIVEDLSTSWYLNAVLQWLREHNPTLPELSFTPAGDAHQIAHLATLLNIQSPNTLLLAKPPAQPMESLAQSLWQDVIEPLNGLVVMEDEPEDMLPPDVFKSLVQRAWFNQLNGIELYLDTALGGVAAQYQQAFETRGLCFDRIKPARIFLQRMGESPDALLYGDAPERFTRLFQKIADKLHTIKL